jgi:hypothetical protein
VRDGAGLVVQLELGLRRGVVSLGQVRQCPGWKL